ncbi:hypothetical protein GOB93_20470 [Acetobacter musti]|uniref:HNH endonuclease n=1 Tax=Acetobacter musti TaxID=864732 RepID=A0ABX0JTV6_9PROT|nr:hypothetical protein [Acetobacter musti]NHN86933.1 hypothetical protein [Acetobacter musti]
MKRTPMSRLLAARSSVNPVCIADQKHQRQARLMLRPPAWAHRDGKCAHRNALNGGNSEMHHIVSRKA